MHPANEIIAERDHAAASGLMHHANTDALVVLDYHHGQPVGIITAADIARAVADGKDLNQVRVHDLLATRHPRSPPPLPSAMRPTSCSPPDTGN